MAARDGGVAPIVEGGFHAGRADPVDTRRVQGRAQAQPAEAFADVPQGARVAARRDDRPGDGFQNHGWRIRRRRKRRKGERGRERRGAARASEPPPSRQVQRRALVASPGQVREQLAHGRRTIRRRFRPHRRRGVWRDWRVDPRRGSRRRSRRPRGSPREPLLGRLAVGRRGREGTRSPERG